MAGRSETEAVKATVSASPGIGSGGNPLSCLQSEKGKAAEGACTGDRITSPKSGEQVESLMARLRLTAVEATAVVIDDTADLNLVDPEKAFVGKVLAPNKLHIQTISAAMRPAWGNPKGLVINPAGDNLFIAEFSTKADRDRVMEGSPWAVGRHAVLMKKYETDVQPQMVVFDRLAIWARILALSNRLMNSQRGTAIASPIGLVTKVESDALGRCWGGYMRLRVEVKVDEPLLRCVTVFSSKLQSTESYAVQYERLPIYCHSCGFIGHSTLVCATPAKRDENDELPYSAKKLSVPDEKRSGGARSGNNASSTGGASGEGSKGSTAGSSAASGRGRGRGTKGGPATGEDQEVSSPVKGGRGRGRGRSARGRGRGSAAGELFPIMKLTRRHLGRSARPPRPPNTSPLSCWLSSRTSRRALGPLLS
ncbi:hypothetical protein D1007_17329 [Hordeum vulgare]|nr:hypothetical protein D1007_17329 [Hordeum vulgare]